MKPLFVSYFGNRKGISAHGWVVVNDEPALDDAMAVEHLCTRLEKARGYDVGTLVVINFRRLEDAAVQ